MIYLIHGPTCSLPTLGPHQPGDFWGYGAGIGTKCAHHRDYTALLLHITIQCNTFARQTRIIMGQSTISIRVDDKLKKSFDELCSEIGLSSSAAVTIFMKAAVREKRIPFELRTETEDEIRAKGLAAFHKLRAIAQENGVAGMSLEEINEEIRSARRGE